MLRTVEANPSAAMLIESMRDIGYSLETALADIVDNSITAGARSIQLFADTDVGRIAVIDDGEGMTEPELFAAMRPGSRSPLEDRDSSDLGRFGLGLKTASFSQCRRLTVVTRRNGSTSVARWDLDYVAATNKWLVLIPDDIAAIPWNERLGEHGTLVVWENLDRFVSDSGSDEGHSQFVERVDDAAKHLELVFHRFLTGEPGLPKVRVSLNNRPLEPFDPFNRANPATIADPPEKIRVGNHMVTVQAFTLPHHRMVKPAEWERYAGAAGYVKNQGFYVYRERRLIVHGTWFGLARQMELTKLARVRIDMPNGLDAEWKIDVKKASAHPPYQVRQRLRQIIEAIGATSKRVYRHRGATLVSESRLPIWIRTQDKDQIVYRLDPNHPILEEFVARLPDELGRDFRKIIEITGSTLPMDSLFADLGSDPEKVVGNAMSDDALILAVDATYNHLRGTGLESGVILEMLRVAEPFRSNWDRTQDLIARIAGGETRHV